MLLQITILDKGRKLLTAVLGYVLVAFQGCSGLQPSRTTSKFLSKHAPGPVEDTRSPLHSTH